MSGPFIRALRRAGLCLALWGAMAAAATTQTFRVTVGGTPYDITIGGYVAGLDLTTANGFAPGHANGQLTALNSWFGNEALAQAVATRFPFSDAADLPAGITNVFFAHSVNGASRQVSSFDRGSGGSVRPDQRKTTHAEGGDLESTEAWAFGTAAPATSTSTTQAESVPEIDGPVLAQALFVLFALYALLAGRRRRRPTA